MIEMAAVRTWIQAVWGKEMADPARMAAEDEVRQLLTEIEELDRLAEEDDGS